jgi:hypothetical protein
MNEEAFAEKLRTLINEINSSKSNYKIKFNRQSGNTSRMSLTGGSDRLGVYYSTNGQHKVSLSGVTIQQELRFFMKKLCGKKFDGFIQAESQPYWKIDDFSLIEKAAYHYATTSR